jgi:hypothetical protein
VSAQAQLDLRLVRKGGERQQVAAVYIETVGRERVDLICRIDPTKKPVSSSPAAVAGNTNHVAVSSRPLALNASEVSVEIKDEIAASAVADGLVYVDAELDRGGRNLYLGDAALLVGAEHTTSLVFYSDN